jgi:hypothetical protein
MIVPSRAVRSAVEPTRLVGVAVCVGSAATLARAGGGPMLSVMGLIMGGRGGI